MVWTIHAEDRYNFNPGAKDIATGTPDSENGIFEIATPKGQYEARVVVIAIGILGKPNVPDYKIPRAELRGRVHFDVFDARGRRVSQGEGGAAGQWMWDGTDRAGRPVAPGIYFVHARDSQGGRAVQRAVLVR